MAKAITSADSALRPDPRPPVLSPFRMPTSGLRALTNG